MDTRGPIIAAVQFDDQLPSLVDAAMGLARRFSAPLSLVNAYAEPQPLLGVAAQPGYAALSRAIALDNEAVLVKQREQMRALVEKVQGPLEIRGKVVVDTPAQGVLAEAAAHDARLIVTACNPGTYSMVPRGFSVALTLMATADVPVLALSSKSQLVFPANRRFRIMVCDDLEPGSLDAVHTAYDWAAKLGDVELTHLHVHGDMREVLQDYWADIAARTPYLRDHFATPEELWAEHEKERKAALAARAGKVAAQAAAAGVQIDQQCRFANDVREELSLATEELAPDLIVFGRHKLLKTKPYLLGRVPLKAMVDFGRPVLVVPEAK
jgi:nucleotide-binding universal stress UspA family protein